MARFVAVLSIHFFVVIPCRPVSFRFVSFPMLCFYYYCCRFCVCLIERCWVMYVQFLCLPLSCVSTAAVVFDFVVSSSTKEDQYLSVSVRVASPFMSFMYVLTRATQFVCVVCGGCIDR